MLPSFSNKWFLEPTEDGGNKVFRNVDNYIPVCTPAYC